MKTIHPLCSILGGNFEPMAQKVIPDKEQKEKEQIRKKEHSPLIQVDKQSDPISNFIANLKHQFREAKALIDWNRLFGGKCAEQSEQSTQPESLIGTTKTVMRSDFKNDEKSQTVQKNKKPALKIDNAIKPQQACPKNKKPKLGL